MGKNGIVEKWNIGMVRKLLKALNPIFHSSNIPIFQRGFLNFTGVKGSMLHQSGRIL
jgi:hypothetical protein